MDWPSNAHVGGAVGTRRSAVRPVPRRGLSRDEAANKTMVIYQVIGQVGIAASPFNAQAGGSLLRR